ncbi:MAG: N-acetylmuramoyl-L-alanine amidase [Rickettsiaceae bacterium]|nr:N-acetylmuramoyl-L-alanine amidase [Rickettsiaceae bacterium]MCP5369279.1 N-acetylmuramoyl-L-alanine amidase [Rickettsiaceae bacterium]
MLFNQDFRSFNYEAREKDIKYVILHYTELTFEQALAQLTNSLSDYRVSAHFLIKKDGEIFQLVSEQNTAWHAGISYWRGEEQLNHSSIGIEIDNLGKEEFTTEQLTSCLNLCAYLQSKYSIATDNFLGHSDIAPDRKIDPGFYFPWKLLAQNGFGLWPTHHYKSDCREVLYVFGNEGADIKVLQHNLRTFGYKVEITGLFDDQTNYVVRAFLSRFCPEELKNLGINYYFDPTSKYSWSNKSQFILTALLSTITP